MSFVKKYKNLKTGPNMGALASGPRNIAGAQVSSMVPCRGAKAVMFHLTSTDVNVPVAISSNICNDPLGANVLTASAFGLSEAPMLQRMNIPGGVSYMATVSGQPMPSGFIQLAITPHASGHTAFSVDVEVVYDGDADDWRNSFGQALIDAVVS